MPRPPPRQEEGSLEAKIDRDGSAGFYSHFRDFDLDVEVPTTARVLGEACCLDLGIGRDRSRLPDPIVAAEHHDASACFVNSKRARSIERHPVERSALARTPCRAIFRGFASVHQMPGDCAGHQPPEIETVRPSPLQPQPLTLIIKPVDFEKFTESVSDIGKYGLV